MRVFVYSKVSSRKIAVINNVIDVRREDNNIIFTTKLGETFTFNTKEVKTTSYQN